MNITDLVGASRRDLAALAARGTAFDPAAIAGHRYDGISLGLPRVIERLTWTKFGKAFHRDPATGEVRGWNIRIEQDALERPWVSRRRRGRPITFGHFLVTRDERGGVVLDYGRGGNRRGDPIALVRDPLVALAGPDVLLGWTYLALAGARIPTPSWFVLRRSVGDGVDPIDLVDPRRPRSG